MKGCTVLGEVIAVYGGWGTEPEPVYGITGGIVRAVAGWGTGRDAAEENTVPGEGVAGYVGWVIESVYVATGAERATGGTVCGATAGGGAVVAAEFKCGTVGSIHKPKRSRWRSTECGRDCLNHLFEGGGGGGVKAMYGTGYRSARGQALCYTWPKNSRRKRWCIAIRVRSMEYNRGYLPSIAFRPPGVRRRVAIRAREGCPFGVPSATGGFLAAVLAGGG